jgi:hypothetical protein
MTPEQVLDKNIMIWCGEHNYLCFHANVGSVKLADGRYFSTGLPKGFPDLLIFKTNGEIAFCETKIHPRKPTQEQLHMIATLQERGFNAFVAYSLQEFIEQINKER